MIGEEGMMRFDMTETLYTNVFFAQESEAQEAFNYIDEHGYDSWVNLVLTDWYGEGEEYFEAPWGNSDSLEYSLSIDPETEFLVHQSCSNKLYISLTECKKNFD